MTSPAPHPSITLRPARDADWDAIRALLEANALPLAGAREHLAHFVVADRDGAVLGCAAIERHGDAALLRSVAVAPGSQGHGVGERLVRALLADAPGQGMHALYLLTTTAAGWFPRFGFAPVPREAAPPALRASAEFQGACPASAVLMARRVA